MAGEGEGLLDQSEIEALFGALSKESPTSKAAESKQNTPGKSSGGGASGGAFGGGSEDRPMFDPSVFQVKPYSMEELASSQVVPTANSMDIDFIGDVDLNVRVELGRTRMYIEEVLKLREGSVVPLDKLAGDPVDIFVNGQLLARGEVLVLNDNFCIRVSEILGDKQTARAEAS